MLQLVRNNLLLLLASQYNSYLLKEREKRKTAEEKDPSLVSLAFLVVNQVLLTFFEEKTVDGRTEQDIRFELCDLYRYVVLQILGIAQNIN
jgi:predicted transcriptional regulator